MFGLSKNLLSFSEFTMKKIAKSIFFSQNFSFCQILNFMNTYDCISTLRVYNTFSKSFFIEM